MRYRKLTPEGDYAFGGTTHFMSNTPETVAQAIKTRLHLFAGEWFLDAREGLALDSIVGRNTQGTRDDEIKQRILNTKGVKSLDSYYSTVDASRGFTVTATVETDYGVVAFSVALPLTP
jgi:hypothetical protein